MHMADALITPAVAGAMYLSSGVVITYGLKKIKPQEDLKTVSLMGIMGAFVFSAQMINFTIPGTGSSGHFCGAMLLSAILGPYAAFLTMAGILLIQCLLFADGGLLALGCNIWNMAFYGCFIGGFVIWNTFMKKNITRTKIIVASMLGSILALQLGAFSVVLQTLISGVTELPYSLFLITMQPIHLAIGIIEGLITSAVLCFIYSNRPELLWHSRPFENLKFQKPTSISLKSMLVILTGATLMIGGLLSLFASSHPDGLEWSIAKLLKGSELSASGTAYEYAGSIQNQTALLPDYAFKGSDSILGTSFSGVIGCLLIISICLGICLILRLTHNKSFTHNKTLLHKRARINNTKEGVSYDE